MVSFPPFVEDSVRKRRVKFGGNKKRNFTEGWVEFADRRVAKAIAMALNNVPIGGKKRNYYHDDIWNIKYLPKFRWTHLAEKKGKEYWAMGEGGRGQLGSLPVVRLIKTYSGEVGGVGWGLLHLATCDK